MKASELFVPYSVDINEIINNWRGTIFTSNKKENATLAKKLKLMLDGKDEYKPLLIKMKELSRRASDVALVLMPGQRGEIAIVNWSTMNGDEDFCAKYEPYININNIIFDKHVDWEKIELLYEEAFI